VYKDSWLFEVNIFSSYKDVEMSSASLCLCAEVSRYYYHITEKFEPSNREAQNYAKESMTISYSDYNDGVTEEYKVQQRVMLTSNPIRPF
jgi:hypothetical protein